MIDVGTIERFAPRAPTSSSDGGPDERADAGGAGGSVGTSWNYLGNLPVGEGVSAAYTSPMRALAPLLLVALPAVAAAGNGPDVSLPSSSAASSDDTADDPDDGDAPSFACDGTDPALLRELDEAFRTRIGFGETWDESICNQGYVVSGGTRELRRRRPAPAASPTATTASMSMPSSSTSGGPAAGDAPGGRSTTAPTTATTTTTGSTVAAAATTASAPAPKKELTAWDKRVNDQFFALAIPMISAVFAVFSIVVASLIGLFLRLRRQIVLDVGCPSCPMRFPFVVGESPQLFCPSCGAPCRIDVTGRGSGTAAHAVPL